MQAISRSLTFSAAVLCAAFVAVCSAADAPGTDKPGTNYDALKDLPDWSGIWGEPSQRRVAGKIAPPGADRLLAEIPPLRDTQALARYKEALAVYVQGGDNIANAAKTRIVYQGTNVAGAYVGKIGTGGLCAMVMAGGTGNFAGRTGSGPETLIEFLFTPGRVTITSDRDVVRRIYTDGRPVPTAPFITNMGTSIGHWEGDALLVHTVGLSPKTVIIGAVEAGEGFTVDERMFVNAAGLMEIDGTITAPRAYTEPFHYTQVFARIKNQNYVMGQYVIDCDHVDRAIDPKKNAQTADLTPPKDIPPPPAN